MTWSTLDIYTRFCSKSAFIHIKLVHIYSHELNYIGATTCRTIIRQLNWNLICFQLLWEIKTNWTIQTTLGLIKYEGQNWGAKLRGKIEEQNWREKFWLYAPSIISWRGVWLGFVQCQYKLPYMQALMKYFRWRNKKKSESQI